MSEHKSCPCGGEPELVEGIYPYSSEKRYRGYGIRCTNIECLWTNGLDETTVGMIAYYPGEAQAWEAWDTRHEPTCKNVIKEQCPLSSGFICSECGDLYEDIYPAHCPSCGSRVEEEV